MNWLLSFLSAHSFLANPGLSKHKNMLTVQRPKWKSSPLRHTSSLFINRGFNSLSGRRGRLWHRWVNFQLHSGHQELLTTAGHIQSLWSRKFLFFELMTVTVLVHITSSGFIVDCVSPWSLQQISGTEILDAIEKETSGTLKDCYTALGLYLTQALSKYKQQQKQQM